MRIQPGPSFFTESYIVHKSLFMTYTKRLLTYSVVRVVMFSSPEVIKKHALSVHIRPRRSARPPAGARRTRVGPSACLRAAVHARRRSASRQFALSPRGRDRLKGPRHCRESRAEHG